MKIFVAENIWATPYLNDVDILDGKKKLTNQPISTVINDLKGKKVLLYSLEGLSYSTDTTLLPYMWNVMELLKRELDSDALIMHGGVDWQKSNGISGDIALQACGVRNALYATYRDIIGSDTTSINSDNFGEITSNYNFLKKAYDAKTPKKAKKLKKKELILRDRIGNLTTFDDTSGFFTGNYKQNLNDKNSFLAELYNPRYREQISVEEKEANIIADEFKKRYGTPLGDFKRAVKHLSKHSDFGGDYTLYELAANEAIINYSRDKGFMPVKISLKNQAVDHILDRKGLNLSAYSIRLPLPVQPATVGVVPYSVPSDGLNSHADYFLITDPLEKVSEKLNSSKNNDLFDIMYLYNFLKKGTKYMDESDVITDVVELNSAFTQAANTVGGYPVDDFRAPIHFAKHLKQLELGAPPLIMAPQK